MTPADTIGVAAQSAPALMSLALTLHIAGGSAGIVSGYVAVFAPKGRTIHRAAGTLFVIAMAVMTTFGLAMAIANDQAINIMAASFALYMVATSWLTVRRQESVAGRLEIVACLAGASIAAYGLLVGMPKAGSFATVVGVFAGLAALGALLDAKVILQRGVTGVGRISRHLWRMCTAFFVATASFFLGQMDEIAEAWRGPHLYVLALAPIALLIFWLVRVRFERTPASSAPDRVAA